VGSEFDPKRKSSLKVSARKWRIELLLPDGTCVARLESLETKSRNLGWAARIEVGNDNSHANEMTSPVDYPSWQQRYLATALTTPLDEGQLKANQRRGSRMLAKIRFSI
jgi:hypothetical protein